MSCVPEKGTLVPDWALTDLAGKTFHAHDLRQKSNLILLVPEASSAPSELARWAQQVDAELKQWLWLQAEVHIIPNPPADLDPGAHAVDRYGRHIRHWPTGTWTLEDLQREYIYYEARHC